MPRVTVLGNHDFHLLTVAAGHRKPHRDDTLDDDSRSARSRRAGRAGSPRGRWWWSKATSRWCTRASCRRGRSRRRSCCRAKCEAMLASDRAHEFLRRALRRRAAAMVATTSRASIACAWSSTRARGCASARADDTMELSEKRGPRHTPDGSRRGSSIPPALGARDDRLRPLVDARPHARAERADARLRLPVGRARLPRSGLPDRTRVSGSVALAGAAKAVRIDASAARASSRRCASRAGNAGRATSSTVSARSPQTPRTTRTNDVSPT